jgi:predicted enzyme related to lactoylglutathione lyase
VTAAMPNPFIHIELQTQDLAKAKAFYAALFDWRLDTLPRMTYTMIEVGEGTGGGMMQAKEPSAPSLWIPFIEVDDVHGTTERVRTLGGTVLKEPAEVPGYGWYSVLTDPTGATFGIWKPETTRDAA